MLTIKASKDYPFSVNCTPCENCKLRTGCKIKTKSNSIFNAISEITSDKYNGVFELTLRCSLYINDKQEV